MDDLLRLLKILENDNTIVYSKYLSHYIPIVKDISQLALNILITDEGECNWTNIDYLKGKKYNVNPIESGAFGWLIGGIFTSKGIITYG